MTKVTTDIPQEFTDFLRSQTLLTIATASENEPYCASCFYSFIAPKGLLVFRSDRGSRHIREAISSSKVAGTINPVNLQVGEIVGMQFQGTFSEPEGELLCLAQVAYFEKFPFAAELPGDFWVLHLNYLKMTDNRKTFGEKKEWLAQLNYA